VPILRHIDFICDYIMLLYDFSNDFITCEKIKMKYHSLILCSLLFFISTTTTAQTDKNYVDSGNVMYQRQNYTQAIECYNNAIKENKRNATAYYWRGKAKDFSKDYIGAAADYKKVIKLDTSFSKLIFAQKDIVVFPKRIVSDTAAQKDIMLFVSNDISMLFSAIPPKDKIVLSDSAIFYNNSGNDKEKYADYIGAIDDYTKAISFNPTWVSPYKNREKAKRIILDYEGAIQDCNEIIALSPSNEEYYNERAIVKLFNKDYKGAIADYTLVINLDPKSAYEYANRAHAYYCLSDYKNAIIDYDVAILLFPKPSNSFSFNKTGNAKFYNLRGLVKQHSGDIKGAIEDYTECITIDPSLVKAYYNRGNAEYETNNKIEGCLNWNTAATLNDSLANDSLKKYCN